MKKLLLGSLIASGIIMSNTMADEQMSSKHDLYVGVDYIKSSNTFTVDVVGIGSGDFDDDSKAFKLKFGALTDSGFRVQGYLASETYDIPVFDNTHDRLIELGVDLIKTFEVTPEFSPFIQAGLGYGWMNVDGYSESSLGEISVKIGAGAMYKVTQEIEILGGIDFQARRWQDIQYLGYTVETTEKSRKLYIGLNYLF